MPSTTPTLLHRIVDRLAKMAADADYAQRRMFEIRTGIDLAQSRRGRPYAESASPISASRISGDAAPSDSRSPTGASSSSRARTTAA